MLKLKFKNEPYWLDLGMGVRVKVKPCTSSVFYEAKAFMNSKVAEVAKLLKDVRENGAKDKDLPDLEDITKREAYADQQLILGLALAGIIEWDGILEAETDEKAPLTPVKIEELFTNFWSIAETFRQQYCGIQEILEAEKNAYTPEQNGTSAPGGTTAKGALVAEQAVPSTNADM
ncbi:MAG: hypothetical protein IJ532_06790 [Alphaproteobacteria bacterium]|nr:hypothetical protein [Alphaproteobacteria bacterium]